MDVLFLENTSFGLVWFGVGRRGIDEYVLQVIGGAPGEFGFGYYLTNLLIFVVLQPALILLFFCLWRQERVKNHRLTCKLALPSSV